MTDIAPPLLASFAAALCFYLAAPRQQWLHRPLSGRVGRFAGSALLATAYLLWYRQMQGAAAFFILLSIVMLLFTLLPALSLLKTKPSRSKA